GYASSGLNLETPRRHRNQKVANCEVHRCWRCLFNVRFTPESRHPAVRSECPISPNSGHYPKIASIFTLSYEVKPAEKGYEQTSADWHALRSQI
ncbi:MAG: hypothetical protein WBV66_09920, partial [Pseudolabrys sp.]